MTLPGTEPQVNPETLPFWEASVNDVLLLPRCDDCGFVIWYPRLFCPVCQSRSVSWFEASGRGTIYSFTVSERGVGPWAEVAPYAIAYVDLEEGPRVLTNIVDSDLGLLEIGDAVTVRFEPAGAYKLARFVKV
jgi:uncharacterized protein